MSRSKLVVGLDIGTTKVCAVVGEATERGVDILGVGSHPNHGLRKGVVNNIESTCASIERALEDAELAAGCEIHSVYVGLTGWQIRSMMSHGVAKLIEGEVGEGDLARVMEAAGAVVLPKDREVIHVLPCEYIVDGCVEKAPLGRAGVRFEVNCHVVTSVSASVNNILECCRQTGLYVEGVVFEPIASAMAVLTREEREQGVAMLDIGGGTSDLVVFRKGAVVHSAVIPMGGKRMTEDIAQVLKLPESPTSEVLKRRYGAASRELTDYGEIEVELPGNREVRYISKAILADILGERIKEMLQLCKSEMTNGCQTGPPPASIVLTGGCSLLSGIDQLAQRIFQLPVRIGRPAGLAGKVKDIDNPQLSTGVGLVLYGVENAHSGGKRAVEKAVRIDRVLTRMKKWIANLI